MQNMKQTETRIKTSREHVAETWGKNVSPVSLDTCDFFPSYSYVSVLLNSGK